MLDDNTLTINRPENVYIPILDDEITILPKVGDYVYKDMILGHTKGDNKRFLYSNISGRVKDFAFLNIFNNEFKQIKCLTIGNDYKEIVENLKGSNKQIDDISKENFLNILTSNYLMDKNGNLLSSNYEGEIDNIIINLSSKNEELSYYLINNYVNEILEAIDALVEINKIKNCYLIINKSKKKTIKLIEQYIGTYLNIKLQKVRKEITNDELITKYKLSGNSYFENIKTIYHIYDVLKYNTPLNETYIYFLNNGVKSFLKVKLGTSVDEIFKMLNINSNYYTVNDQYKIIDKNLVINQIIDSIIIDNNI